LVPKLSKLQIYKIISSWTFIRNETSFYSCGETALNRVIAFVGPLYFVDVIWGTVSLHAWLYISSTVAAFYTLSHFTKKLARRNS
jgi:hypothetical protein